MQGMTQEIAAAALQRLQGILGHWNWTHAADAEVVAALVPATLMQACWTWRPLVSIIGASDSGKSTLLSARSLCRCSGEWTIAADRSTEAGLRQADRLQRGSRGHRRVRPLLAAAAGPGAVQDLQPRRRNPPWHSGPDRHQLRRSAYSVVCRHRVGRHLGAGPQQVHQAGTTAAAESRRVGVARQPRAERALGAS